MAKITKKQISEKDPFGELSKSAKIAKGEVKLLEQSIEMLAVVAKNIKGGLKGLTPNSSAGIKKINEQTAKANTISKERERIQKKLNIANSTAVDRNTELNVQLQEQRKINKQLAKEKLGLIGAYAKESKRLIDLRNQYKNLAVQNKQNTKEGRALLKNLTQLDRKLKQVDATVGQNQRNVGNYTSAIGKLRGGFTRLFGALGIAGGFMALRKVGTMFTELEEGAADISKTTGLAKDAAIELSVALLKIDTRSSLEALQKLSVAAGRLGIEGKDNILSFTQAADKVFVSLGDDLPGTADEIATSMGKISSLFGLEDEFGIGEGIEKAGSGINELAANSKASAGPILDFTNRLAAFAEVLKLEDVQALGALFNETGQSAEVAASTMLKLLPKLATDFRKFAKIAGKTPEEFKAIAENAPIEALKLVAIGAKSNQKGLFALTETLEAYGISSVRATGIVGVLTNSTERLTELQKISGDAIRENTSLTDEFNSKNNTLLSDISRLQKRFSEWLFGINKATGGLSKARKAVQFLTKNLSTILKVLKLVVIAWAGWKLGKIVSNIMSASRGLGDLARSLFKVKGATNSATASQVKYNTAVKSNPIGLIISVLATAVALLWDYADAADGATSKQQRLNDMVEEFKGLLEDDSGKKTKFIDREIDLIQKKTELQSIAAKTEKERLAIEKKGMSDILDKRAQLDNSLGKELEIKKKQLAAVIQVTIAEKKLSDLTDGTQRKRLTLDLDKKQKEAIKSGLDVSFVNTWKAAWTSVGFVGAEISLLEKERANNIEKIVAANHQIKLIGVDIVKNKKDENNENNKGGALNRLQELQLLLKENRDELKAFARETTDASDERVTSLNTEARLYQLQIDQIKELFNLDVAKEKELDPQRKRRLALLRAEIAAQKELRIIDIDDATDEGEAGIRTRDLTKPNFIDELKSKRDLEIKKREINLFYDKIDLEDLQKAQDKHVKLTKSFDDKLIEQIQQFKLKIKKGENEIEKLKLEAFQEDNMKKQLDLEIAFDQKQINGDFKTKEALIKAEKEFQKALIDLKIEAIKNEQALSLDDALKFKQFEKQIKDLELEKKDIDKTDTDESDKFELRRAAVDLYTQYFITQADKRIDKINQEIAAAQRQANILEGLAASGNITARESLAEQDQIIAEANLRKERLEKRKQNILLVSSILNAYNSALEAGDTPSEAFTSAITNTEVLTRFVEALPTFFDGIEDTGTHGQGVDGRGGFNAILHPNERVMTANQNAKMGGLSNEEVAGIIEQHRYGQFITVAPKMATEKGNVSLEREMVLVRKAIENQEVQNIELAEITQAAMVIRKTVKQGNRVTHSRFKVN